LAYALAPYLPEILTRPLGATLGDILTKPIPEEGLNLRSGKIQVSTEIEWNLLESIWARSFCFGRMATLAPQPRPSLDP
jgi:uncharacterized membrane-anchored protein